MKFKPIRKSSAAALRSSRLVLYHTYRGWKGSNRIVLCLEPQRSWRKHVTKVCHTVLTNLIDCRDYKHLCVIKNQGNRTKLLERLRSQSFFMWWRKTKKFCTHGQNLSQMDPETLSFFECKAFSWITKVGLLTRGLQPSMQSQSYRNGKVVVSLTFYSCHGFCSWPCVRQRRTLFTMDWRYYSVRRYAL